MGWLLTGLALSGSAQAAVLHTPGYKGIHKVPKVKPAPLPTPIVLSTSGEYPQVIVDAAGTAHITWTEEGDATRPSVTHYCRLDRGATACSATASLVPPQDGDPGGNQEFQPPRVLAAGDDLLIVSYRYPNVVAKPDIASSGATYMWTSDDGGRTITGPGLVGKLDVSGVPAVYGPPDNPRVGLITDTTTGGTFFQALSPGKYNGAEANLADFDPDCAYSGSLATVGVLPVAAFACLNGQIYVRGWTGQGDEHDPATWTRSAPLAGTEPRIASGPSGLFMISRSPTASRYEVRPVSGTAIGAPTAVSPTGVGSRDLFEDPGGHLFAGWVAPGKTALEAYARMSRDGKAWGTPLQLLTATKDLDHLADLDIATAADGGGFAVGTRSSRGGRGEVLAAPFGNQLATGKPGLGNQAGGGIDPDAQTTCQTISFGAVRVVGQQGCFLSATDGPPGTKVSEGPVRINGIDFIPDPKVRILINPKNHTIDSTGKVTVQGTLGSSTPVVFLHDPVSLKIPTQAKTAQNGTEKQGAILFSYDSDKFPFKVKGFPVQGKVEAEVFSDGTARIPISLELPEAFGGISGDVELFLDNTGGLHLNSLKFRAKDLPIFGVALLKDFTLEYDGSEETWSTSIALVLPPVPTGPKVDGEVIFKGGKLDGATITAGPPYPGLSVAPATFLTSIGGGFKIDPDFTLIAKASLGGLPVAPPSTYTVGVDGKVTLKFGKPISYSLEGAGELFGTKLENAYYTVNTDGFASAGGDAELDLDAVSVEGRLDASIDAGNAFAFGGHILGKICIAGACLTKAEAVVSSKGVGACITTGLTYGFVYHWGHPITDVELHGPFTCDLTDYAILPPQKGADGKPANPTFPVAAGTDVLNLKVKGDGGLPNVALLDPAGKRIFPVDAAVAGATDDVVVARTPGSSQEFIGIKHPAAGTWTVELQPGSPAILEVGRAEGLPAPRVGGDVVPGAGAASAHAASARRVLSYTATRRKGLTVTFVEQGNGVSKVIGRATRPRGTIRFRPAIGPGGRRSIVAFGEQDGLPRFRRAIASYTAPAPAGPARVRGVRIRRAAGGITVRWRRAAGASSYAVRARLSDGRVLFAQVAAATRRASFGGAPRGTRISVTVTAHDASGRVGRPGRAHLRR